MKNLIYINELCFFLQTKPIYNIFVKNFSVLFYDPIGGLILVKVALSSLARSKQFTLPKQSANSLIVYAS